MAGSVRRLARVRLGRHDRPRTRSRAIGLAVVGRRGPPSHASGRDRAGARRHCVRGRGRRRQRAGARWPPASSRWRSRSARTSPTTTATGCGAPTIPAGGSGRCAWSAGASSRPGAVKRAALLSFGVAVVAGLALAAVVGPELLVVGAAALAAGWFYTGGSHPYGYYGYGELFVFTFFGVVATAGSAYVQTDELWALPLRRLGAGGAVGDRAAGGQQPPRHPRRHRVGQAHARRPDRRRPHPVALRRHARRRVRLHPDRRRWLRSARPPAAALVGVVLARQPVLQVLGGRRRSRPIPRPGRDRPRPARRPGSPPRRPGLWLSASRPGRSEAVAASQGWTTARKRSGCSRWAAWPAPSIEGEGGVGADLVGQALGEGGELGVVGAGEHEHRHRRGGGARARTGPASRCRPARGSTGGPSTVFSRRSARNGALRREAGEERLGEPVVEEPLEAVALDARGGGQVLLAPLLTLLGVLDAGGGTEQHEPAHELRVGRARCAGRSARPSSSRGRWPRRPDRR